MTTSCTPLQYHSVFTLNTKVKIHGITKCKLIISQCIHIEYNLDTVYNSVPSRVVLKFFILLKIYFTRKDNEKMRTNEDSGLETTLGRRSVIKGPLIQRFVRSVRETFIPLRSGGGSTSILRNIENLCVELDNDSPHQSDIDLLDSNEIK
ncbi:hypothetical protein OUZ56_003756 [Daphnia magna]|uniref:Uncharacterized protein n=1 Tax=Daphnia magna TaxID=35525 RepID=A0ABR0A9W4_9CRUS|nr:hypothetical protein OUZ56_003756 [Daphnia magna]